MRFAPLALALTALLAFSAPAMAGKVDVESALADKTIGNADAPVTIIEYASLTCHHCANFHNKVLPEVKKQLIETGKAKLIFRDFPLDGVALKGSMMARCAPEDKFFPLLSVIFSNQERWTKAQDPVQSLAQLGALAGMDADRIKECMADEPLQKEILERQQKAQKAHNIHETPSFLFMRGEEKMDEYPEFTEIYKSGGKHDH